MIDNQWTRQCYHGNVISVPVIVFSRDTQPISRQGDMRRNTLEGLMGNAFLKIFKRKLQ